jgi:hypothetical protein
MRRLVLALTLSVAILAAYSLRRAPDPDPRLISLAVRATVFALPTPTPQIIEVTRIVEVTRVVEITRVLEVTPTSTITATSAAGPTPTPQAAVPEDAKLASVAAVSLAAPDAAPNAEAEPVAEAPPPDVPPEPPAGAGCPTGSDREYAVIPVMGPRTDRADTQHGDLNLALRGYRASTGNLALADINGPTDGDPPQLGGILADGRSPQITSAYQVNDWNWSCGENGCRGDPLQHVEVSLIGLRTSPGEPLRVPPRSAEIYGGGYVALVLFADTARITLVYTREDSVANGYSVHVEGLCVDPNLVARYQAANQAGRGQLPALRSREVMGTAAAGEVLVAIRDRGSFTDPRSRKDWWHGY